MPTDTQIDDKELLAAVRANLAEAAKDKEATEDDKDGDSAVQVKNPLDPDANEEKKDKPVAEEKTTVEATPVIEAAPASDAPVVEHLADGSGVQKHSAGALYPWVVYAQAQGNPDELHYGVLSPLDQNGKLYGTNQQDALDAAIKEKAEHGHRFASSSVSEAVTVDIKEILNGNDQLSEEFKEKAAIIFNTAVKMQVQEIAARLEEQFTEKKTALDASHAELTKNLQEKFETELSEAQRKFEVTLSEKIDGYFGALSEEWMQENELALEGGIQAELVESFIGGMRSLFEQHYVDMPEEKRDLLGEANAKAAELEKSVATLTTEATEAKTALTKLQREKIIVETAHSMTELDASRFKTLMEDFEFDNEESFTKKAQTVKDSFFRTKAALTEQRTVQPTATAAPAQVEIIEEQVIPVEPARPSTMDTYVKALRTSA